MWNVENLGIESNDCKTSEERKAIAGLVDNIADPQGNVKIICNFILLTPGMRRIIAMYKNYMNNEL